MLEVFKSTIGNPFATACDPDEAGWVSLVCPNDGQTSWLRTRSGISRDFVEASLDREETARVDRDDEAGQALVIVDCPSKEPDDDGDAQYRTRPFSMVISDGGGITTVCLTADDPTAEARGGRHGSASADDAPMLCVVLLATIVDRYQRYLVEIKREFDRVEARLRKTLRNDGLLDMLRLEKSLVYFSTSLKSMESVVRKLSYGKAFDMGERERDALEDVDVELRQAMEMTQIYMTILNGTMEALGSIINNDLGLVMRRLTIITIMLAIPSIVFSFYGMNVSLPLVPFGWVFPFVLAACAACVIFVCLKEGEVKK